MGPSLLITLVIADCRSFFNMKYKHYVTEKTVKQTNNKSFWYSVRENLVEIICGISVLILFLVGNWYCNWWYINNIFIYFLVFSLLITPLFTKLSWIRCR